MSAICSEIFPEITGGLCENREPNGKGPCQILRAEKTLENTT